MYKYDYEREKKLRDAIVEYAEEINLIYSAEECADCITPAILVERDRRSNFIAAIESIDVVVDNPDIITGIICSFVDFLDTDEGFNGFNSFYRSVYYDIDKIIRRV